VRAGWDRFTARRARTCVAGSEEVCVRVVVMGAGGYIGSRLVPALLAEGHDVTATFTDASSAGRFWWAGDVDVVEMDILDRASARSACAGGADALYYLIHGLAGDDFATSDREGAYHAAHAAVRSRVGRIIYLGGLIPDVDDGDLSPHLRSRLEVEDILTDSGLPTLALRAAMVLGSGSTSFEIMRQLSERLPVQVLPTWMGSHVEPVAVTDVVTALVGALAGPERSRAFDIGSGERMTYAALLRLYADVAGLRRVQVKVPLIPTGVVTRLAPVLTSAPASTVQTLVESLHQDMVCGGQDFLTELMPPGHVLVPVAQAVARALGRPDPGVPDRLRDVLGPLSSDARWTLRRAGSPQPSA
jgi:uncharacterized protein YbjT (DUF2867 family)